MACRIALIWLLACATTLTVAADRVRKGPQPLRGGEHGVGEMAEEVQFKDLDGNQHNLTELAKENRLVVVAMTSTSCPLSLKYYPTLIDLAKQYADKQIQFLMVNSVSADDLPAMKKAADRLGDNAAYVFDEDTNLAAALGIETTTDVMVINPARTIVYHGAVDDQYGFGYALPQPRNNYLSDAIDALLDGNTPEVEATTAPGCYLSIKKSDSAQSDITYHGRVARLMNRHCVQCHRDAGVAPFPLDTYEDVVAHAAMIRNVVQRGIMPPWFAATNDHGTPSPWSNDASLSPAEEKDLIAWIDGDQAEGDPADSPNPVSFSGRWNFGQPDAVVAFPEPVPVRARGVMPYKHISVETNFDEDKWVQAVEILPGKLSVVHHVLVYMVPPGGRVTNPIDYWAVYTPGNGLHVYPDGYARKLPKGATLVFQMHYTPDGTATEDLTKIGFQFADKPPQYEVQTASVINARFEIPPRAKDYKVEAKLDIPVDVEVLGFLPHHHLRGVAARYELVTPDGDRQLLLDVPEYDFNWQLFYQYAEPPVFPKGSTIRYTAWYDNSEENPANPDPNDTVRFGDQTFDEMHIGYLEYAVPLDAPWADKHRNLRGKLIKGFDDLDLDDSGELSPEEVAKMIPDWAPVRISELQIKGLFGILDSDKSGGLNKKEFEQVRRRIPRRMRN